MEGILIYLGVYVGISLVFVFAKLIFKIVNYYKYSNRLRILAPEINSINLSVADSELNRLDSLYSSTLKRIDDKYKISFSQDLPSVEQFVLADKIARRRKRNVNKPQKSFYKRRY